MSLFGDIPRLIRTMRGRAGLSRADLARKSRVPDRTLASYETGATSPQMSTFEEIAAACQVDSLELLSRYVGVAADFGVLYPTSSEDIQRELKDAIERSAERSVPALTSRKASDYLAEMTELHRRLEKLEDELAKVRKES